MTSESIFVRVQRVVSGGVGSAVDFAEQLSSTSLMRQAIRDMHAAISKTLDQADAALTRRLQAEHQLGGVRRDISTLLEQARFAIDKGREDLAEAALSRQIDLERQAEALDRLIADSRSEEQRLEESLADLRSRAAEMEKQLSAFQSAKAAAEAEPNAHGSPRARAERKAEQAQQAFDRALERAGGVAGEPFQPAVAAKVAEIEALRRETAVADRLARLRAESTSSGEPVPGASRTKRRRG